MHTEGPNNKIQPNKALPREEPLQIFFPHRSCDSLEGDCAVLSKTGGSNHRSSVGDEENAGMEQLRLTAEQSDMLVASGL